MVKNRNLLIAAAAAVVGAVLTVPAAHAVIKGTACLQAPGGCGTNLPSSPSSTPAGISCSHGPTACSGPATRLIASMRSNRNGITTIGLAVPASSLGTCNRSDGVPSGVALASGAAGGAQLAMVLSALAADHTLRVELAPNMTTCSAGQIDIL